MLKERPKVGTKLIINHDRWSKKNGGSGYLDKGKEVIVIEQPKDRIQYHPDELWFMTVEEKNYYHVPGWRRDFDLVKLSNYKERRTRIAV